MPAGFALAGGLAAWAALIAATALQRAQARRVLARYPAAVRVREDFRERYGSLYERIAVGQRLVTLARAGWSLAFIAFFFVFALSDLSLGLEVATAAVCGIIFTVSKFTAARRDEAAYATQLGIKTEFSRLERVRLRAIYRVLVYGQTVLWLVGCAFLGYGAAHIVH